MSHDLLFMREIVVIFGTALLAAWVFRLIRTPSIIGFLVTGILIGPSGLGLIKEEDVAGLREVGLILLLFMIGLELSPKPLLRMGRSLLLAAGAQIITTCLVTALALGLAGGMPLPSVLTIGFAVSLSSTAIVLRQLTVRGETDTVSGMISTGILLLQDIAVIIIMLVLPLLATVGDGAQDLRRAVLLCCVGIAAVALLALFGRRALASLLDLIVGGGGRELSALFAVLMACTGAWLAGLVGWSPALGACIAGLLLAEVDARHQLAADILPFQDVFNALFFVSLGMMVKSHVISGHMLLLIGAVVTTLIVKSAMTAGAVTLAGWPPRLALQVGLGLCSVSEFGYVLGLEAARIGILSGEDLDMFGAGAVGTMLLGAMIFPIGGSISSWFFREVALSAEPDRAMGAAPHVHHVIIVGYGANGQNLARVLTATRIAHCLIEINPHLVRQARRDGVEVVVGDATRMPILEHAGIDRAHALVVVINDPTATARIVLQARAVRPDLFILARTRFVGEIDALRHEGATRVIPEEFETSIEIAAQVLHEMDIPDNVIDAQVAAIRVGNYSMLRGKAADRAAQAELIEALSITATRTHYLGKTSAAAGKTIAELNLPARTGVTIIAVVRNGKPHTNPDAELTLRTGDVLILLGAHVELEAAKALLGAQDNSQIDR